MKKVILFFVIVCSALIYGYAQYAGTTSNRRKADINYGFYNIYTGEYKAIKSHDKQLYSCWNITTISFDDDDYKYLWAITPFAYSIENQDKNMFIEKDGNLYSMVRKRVFNKDTKESELIEVTLPIVYYVKNVIIIHDVTNSLTSDVLNANAIRITLY
ncbi:MAG: hypothetical protein FWC34_02540 [Bacteroidetes bacterium]|nr:hypothetical protein [Bacteroidota bacterium]